RTEAQAVKIVAARAEVDAEAVVKRLADVGRSVAVRVLQIPEIRDAGVPDLTVSDEDARPDPFAEVAIAVAERNGVVGPARSRAVLEQPDPLGLHLPVLRLLAQLLLVI